MNKKNQAAELRARLKADPEDHNALLNLEVIDGMQRDKDRVAAREAQFIGGGNVIRVTSEKLPTTAAVKALGNKRFTVEATQLSVVIPRWARPQIEAVLATDRNRDRRHLLKTILVDLGPNGGEFLVGEELPIESTYERLPNENMA